MLKLCKPTLIQTDITNRVKLPNQKIFRRYSKGFLILSSLEGIRDKSEDFIEVCVRAYVSIMDRNTIVLY